MDESRLESEIEIICQVTHREMGGRGGKLREGNSDEGVGGVWGWMARTQRSIAENGEGIRRNELRRDNVMSFLAKVK